MKLEAGRSVQQQSKSPIEDALRWLATRRHAKPFGLLVDAIEKPNSDSAAQLEPLTLATMSLPGGSVEKQALAAWGLIIQSVDLVGSSNDSRRRNTLIAAFRLPRRPEIKEPWKSSLNDRFHQLMALPGVFGDPEPTTTTPMHKAWARALTEHLVPTLRERLAALTTDGAGWQEYVEIAQRTEAIIAREQASRTAPEDPMVDYRPPSAGAQPVFLDLFVTTVFMRGRSVYRRIIERLVTAQEDGVDSYMARALLGYLDNSTNTPVRALWGCESAPVVASRPSEPILTRLRFPRKLRRGEKHYFCSEATDENITIERLWVNIEVDHHGIAPGQRMHGHVPISGLTIRILFDNGHLPEACWWYAEQTERERRQQPPDGDPHLLTIVSNTVEHTFTGKCHPRENYGISFLWPES